MALRIERSEESDWEGLNFVLYLAAPMVPDQQERLRQMILSWYTVGLYSGFGEGAPHFLSDIGFEYEGGQHYVEWWVDMGNLEPKALRVLQRCVSQFCDLEGVQAQKLYLGQHYIE